MEKLADHIIFIGFMGSGKSSVARRLARFEKMNCIDVDEYIEREAGMPISRIFEVEGEKGFRQREREFLRTLLIRDRCVLSCGGGIVMQEDNRELLKQLGTVIYLKVSAGEAISRIQNPETRPLLSGETPPEELLEMRLPYYEETAEIVIDTNGLDISQVTTAVQRALIKMGKLKPSGRPDRTGRPDKTGRPDGSRSPDRAGRPSNTGRLNGSGRPDRTGRPDRSGRPDREGRPDGSGRQDREGRTNQTGKPGQTGGPDRAGRPNQTDKPEQPRNPNQTDKPEHQRNPNQTGKSNQPANSGHPVNSGQPANSGQPGNPSQSGNPNQTGRP